MLYDGKLGWEWWIVEKFDGIEIIMDLEVYMKCYVVNFVDLMLQFVVYIDFNFQVFVWEICNCLLF